MPFILIFILFPMAEIMVFIQVSHVIGLGTAFFIALCTAILGGTLVRNQGIAILFSARSSMDEGRMPSHEIFDGICIVAAGVALITPGFITDTIGFLLLTPAVRRYLRGKITTSSKFGFTEFHTTTHSQYRAQDPDVIEAEYETVETDKQQ